MASAFLKAEKEYQVNALFLIGLAANESGWATSQLAIYKKQPNRI